MIAAYTGKEEWRHAESLFGGMETLLRRRRWTVQSLSGVAVSVGPGSFTGIRIGLAAARALGQGLRIPVAGVSSLAVMAAGAQTSARWLFHKSTRCADKFLARFLNAQPLAPSGASFRKRWNGPSHG